MLEGYSYFALFPYRLWQGKLVESTAYGGSMEEAEEQFKDRTPPPELDLVSDPDDNLPSGHHAYPDVGRQSIKRPPRPKSLQVQRTEPRGASGQRGGGPRTSTPTGEEAGGARGGSQDDGVFSSSQREEEVPSSQVFEPIEEDEEEEPDLQADDPDYGPKKKRARHYSRAGGRPKSTPSASSQETETAATKTTRSRTRKLAGTGNGERDPRTTTTQPGNTVEEDEEEEEEEDSQDG
jgi:hypothetical protein